jgi:hypothetical protein
LILLLNRLEGIELSAVRLPDIFFLLPFIAYKRRASCVASPLMWLDKEYETEKEYFKPLYHSLKSARLWVLSTYWSLSECPFTDFVSRATEILGS